MSYYTMAMDLWGGVGLFMLALPAAAVTVRSLASLVERSFAHAPAHSTGPISLHHG
jgi:hypothetical protein